MSDFNKPTLGSTYTNFITEINNKFSDLALALDPAVTAATNIPTNAIRLSTAAAKWQKWNGSSWLDAVTGNIYAINISGNAATSTTAVTSSTCIGNSATASTCTGNSATATVASTCTGNSASATTSAACSGNSVTATTAATCSGNAASASTTTGNAATATTSTYLSTTTQINIITGKIQSMNMESSAADGSFIARSSGTGNGNLAGMAFHNDNYAIKLGIRADGYFGLGGWSRTAWSWYSDPSGNMVAAGNVTAYSDPKLKQDFQKVQNPLALLRNLDGGTFVWKEGFKHTEIKAGKRDYGILADQVKLVMPEIVSPSISIDGEQYDTVAYDKLVPVLIEAIKALEDRLALLEGK